jgi:UDPglucose 6-dehydrogenase
VRVGWVGLGKLGSVCASVLAAHGHDVLGFDISRVRELPRYEALAAHLTPVPQGTLGEVVTHSEIVFVAVQTPHAPAFGGETEIQVPAQDFEYGYLVEALRALFAQVRDQSKKLTVVIVSTVLPGTINRLVRPLVPPSVTLLYNPFFIAMGTTVQDFENPEFVLVGADDPSQVELLDQVYHAIHDRPLAVVSIESAELTKVAYNTFISLKIVFANTMMEIAHKTGADCDQVVECLSLATQRVVSPAYLRGGMGDGGACHPRDNVAMSWLANRLDLSVDLMGFVTDARERQSGYLADLAAHWARMSGTQQIVLLGLSYKPGSPLLAGSPALLLQSQLENRGWEVWTYEPYISTASKDVLTQRAVFVVTTRHPEFRDFQAPPGSVVIDPHGYVRPAPRVTLVGVGRKAV